ncbi:hypothetical protein [Stenotrophomonas rhizophila]|uniref:hypothetical protein n=1 Tax=Stenotrophomonas rhizophila TaxID=216778 RepID=UPI0028D84AF5|nr:hypothetical protein [Stenotrophomonas rhizophila]
MKRVQKELSLADVAGWGSACVTFGLIQGALYLQAYWSQFGLDPFQFVAVGELALTGLAGIGMVLGLMLITLLLEGWVEGKLTGINTARNRFAWLAPVLFFTGLGAIIWWASAWVLLIGMLLTVGCLLVVTLSPVVPGVVKESPWLAYIVAMLVYVSIASHWLGSERARAIIDGNGKHLATVIIETETLRDLNLVGRLGDTYALWDPARKTAVLVPAGDVRKLETARKQSAATSRVR